MRRAASTPPELPGYQFIKLLGSGGFSDVFLYEQKLPRRRVAVKVLLTEELTPANRAAFVAEANLMAQLSAHPYIVTIYHADVASDDRPYFVMEYCSGPSLSERYKRERFQVVDALRTGVRLSSAIATAHSAGILHRDIKPANVLTNDYGWPALTDFGISSTLEDELPVHTTTLTGRSSDTGTGSTTSGQSVGMSVPWSPPEMFEDDPEPDVRSDVFSLAATIYTLLAGRTPFEIAGRSNGTLDLIGRIERGVVTPMPRDDVPRSLLAVLQKGMSPRREERFATAVDFARALQRVELELGYAPTNIEVPNLDLRDTRDDNDDDGDDVTRVRSVATVNAQPRTLQDDPDATRARSVTPIAAQADDGTVVRSSRRTIAQPDEEDRTVVRSRQRVEPEPDHTVIRRRDLPAVGDAAQPASVEEQTAPRGGRGKVVGIIVGAAAAVVAAVVIVSVVLTGGTAPGPTRPTPSADGGDAIIDKVAQPADMTVTPSADGASIVFSWTNPEPEKDDRFVWYRTEQPDLPQVTEEPTITVPADGTRMCVAVEIRRSGRSSEPTTGCYPS
ncbi:serine/threonine protein kinase [Diaminobutyricimonas aerilata]|uniref:non-specific serine/threonine protein kinase n=1 Tax=Diaminobutyricimonas aerilata TaxID=1162967 RepID=A0A2M9CII2_9MICO|nr:serine/threonine-protein kinase [Diaminobutyricimonas aerilata]PJJ71672.1 serine/threonine protein kinase [Diaminobutyricimonas aerilata]